MMGLASPSHKWDTWRRNHWNIVHNSRRLRKREKKSVGWRKVHARSPFERSASARYPRRFRRARRDDKVGRRLQSPNRRRPLKLNCLHKENWGKQDISKQNRTLWINNSTHTHTHFDGQQCVWNEVMVTVQESKSIPVWHTQKRVEDLWGNIAIFLQQPGQVLAAAAAVLLLL